LPETVNNFREDQSNESDNQENVPKETTSSTLLQIKKNNIIQYKLPDSEERISATVLGKAGKMTGKNKLTCVITVITLLLIILCGIVRKVCVDFTQSVWRYS
jgi:hypothetical protein